MRPTASGGITTLMNSITGVPHHPIKSDWEPLGRRPAEVGKNTEKTHHVTSCQAGVKNCPADLMVNGASPAPTYAAQQERYEERAAIMEFDGGLTRAEAERLAGEEVFGDA
jgi:hypothetical protein